MTNVERAEAARIAVEAFREACGGSPLDDPEGVEEAISDLICDLLHLAHQHCRVGPFKLLENGVAHYAVERVEDDGMAAHAEADVIVRVGLDRDAMVEFNSVVVRRLQRALARNAR